MNGERRRCAKRAQNANYQLLLLYYTPKRLKCPVSFAAVTATLPPRMIRHTGWSIDASREELEKQLPELVTQGPPEARSPERRLLEPDSLRGQPGVTRVPALQTVALPENRLPWLTPLQK